ncbi:MAG: UDP-2,3-diacylglucosamine diphosphatase [Bacteroidetes bacterium]|nr:UDP-2,3-diacylglucosamine diphosphatase [Bacteroidota bacterium]MCL2302728.1 UDP-2,3-diacylglucosamine diphosphatase [Lentimicrobiaceae bacterium]
MPISQPIFISGVCYFASDFHFGAPNQEESKKRERYVVNWLEYIQKDANHLFLLGDIFDFWFEYNGKPPIFYTFFLDKIAELRNNGVEVYFFTGNHDMWIKSYLKEHLGVHIFKKKQEFVINDKKFLLGHGDGLGKGEFGYKCLKAFLNCKINRWLFGLIPPKTGFAMAHFFSKNSRAMTPAYKEQFLGNEKERLVQFCYQYLVNQNIDYFIFGHRHLPLEIVIENAIYFNTGDWLNHNTYIRYEKIPILYRFDQ